MPTCARCGEAFAADGEWIRLSHHHPHMKFDSEFCSSSCAAAYLSDDLVARK